MPGEVYVLRLGHRVGRDKRVTTHCVLVSRALGAKGIVITGERDDKLVEGVKDLVARWGGGFRIEYAGDWRRVVDGFKKAGFLVVHLTMYGVNLPFVERGLRLALERCGLLVMVGSEKVPKEVYEAVDLNVAITHQPHSEVAALALFLFKMLGEGGLTRPDLGPYKLFIVPRARGKLLLRKP